MRDPATGAATHVMQGADFNAHGDPESGFCDGCHWGSGFTLIQPLKHDDHQEQATASGASTNAYNSNISVGYWNVSAATTAQNLSYTEQAVAFALKGIANARSDSFPTLYLSAGYVEQEDDWWASQLRRRRNLSFVPVAPTLCALEQQFRHKLSGAVAFNDDCSLPFALTLAGQRWLLPVSDAALATHACLRSLPLTQDLRGQFNKTRSGRASACE